jgi:hypothetical protein
MKKSYSILMITLFTCFNISAQVKFGTDIYSRYIWRGLDFGNAPAFQPSLTYSTGGLAVGAWGSYAFPTSSTTYAENDLWASYTFAIPNSGSFSAIFTDYYIPSTGIKFGYFKPENGTGAAHTLEGGICYCGPESLPITLAFYTNLSNETDNSSYIQVSYPFTIDDATITLAAGFVPKKSTYYLTDEAGFTNLSITAAKSIAVTDKFSIPLSVAYIANPSLDITYLVFGASFTF